MTKKINIFYTTCGNLTDSRKLASKLVSNKKIICVNIIKNVESYYKDFEKVKSESENVMVIKSFFTSKELEKVLLEYHPYTTPFVTQLENKEVNKEYLNWAKKKL